MLSPVRTVQPTTAPISLVEAKAHLRVDHADDDALIAALIAAATDQVDGWPAGFGRALVTQTWRADFCGFPGCGAIRLPLSPVQSVASVAYSDDLNADQVFASGSYALFHEKGRAVIVLGKDHSWPSTYDRPDAVRVTFVAGYGAAAAVPSPIKAAILLMVGDLYAFRETAAAGSVSKVPMSTTVEALLAPYRIY